MSVGRVISDEGSVRYVELSVVCDPYAGVPVQQTTVCLYETHGGGGLATLQRPSEDGKRMETLGLTFEELNTLLAAYQDFLRDRERAGTMADGFYDLSSLNDHPF